MWTTEQQNDAVVYLARKLHWSRETIGKLTPAQLIATFNHLQQQEAKDKHEHLSELAILFSVISNAPIPRKNWKGKSASEFYPNIDKQTTDSKRPDTNVEILAKQKGIILPSK